MATNVVMPRISDTMKEGMVSKWLKAEGDAVQKGERIVEIQADKATLEIEAYASGVLRRIVVPEGVTVPLGATIGILADADMGEPEAAAPAPPKAAAAPTGRIKASPIARKIAKLRGIDLAAVTGSGPGGRIVKRDVLAHEPAAPTLAPAAQDEEVPLSPMAKAIAERMTLSKTTTPHLYVTVEVDMGHALTMRAAVNEQCAGRAKITINDLVLKAAAMALKAHPEINSSFAGDRIIRRGGVHIGIAVDAPGGLMVPVVRDCDRKTLAQISAEARELVARARDGRLTEADYTGGTFTISNMGMYSVENFAAIINPPEAALLGVASVRRVPAVVGDDIVPADRMKMTLSGDHRVFNGGQAMAFLNQVRRLLESPMNLVV